MPFQPLKLLFFVTAAAFETLLLHLGASLISIAFAGTATLNWPVLFLTCLLGAWTTARFAPIDDPGGSALRPMPLVIAAVVVVYGLKLQAGGGWSLVSGWSTIVPWAGAGTPDRTLGPPALLILGLAAWWRGMVLIDHDHSTLVATLQRGLLGLVVLVLMLTPVSVTNFGAPPWGQLLGLEAMLVVGTGLVTLSLARIADEAPSRPSRGGWHWLRSSLGTTIALMVMGTLLLSLVSDTATDLVRLVASVIGALAALIFAPMLVLLAQLWRVITPDGVRVIPPMPSAPSDALTEGLPPSDFSFQVVNFLLNLATVILYLLPLLAIILLIIRTRRQRRLLTPDDGEVHESLWSWQGLQSDLADLLKGWRRQPQGGLRDALSRLRAGDPAQRIRRRYIQLLLVGEAAQRERLPQQTPLEHEVALASALPEAEPDLHALTLAYDRARYAPDSIDAADAAIADQAWSQIQARADKENR